MSAATSDSDDATPGARYRRGVAAGEWQDDPAQREALAALDRLATDLARPVERSLWQRLRGERPPAPRGIYLWGRVGRGKTFLTELFCAALQTTRKRRVHFHRFMQDVHAELRTLEGRSDPLVEVAARLAAALDVLVLDEFFVGDIGDAMILGNLLRALFDRGVVLVTTSNTPPQGLYRDGLQRERFLPAIALLEQHCDVIELVSPTDWRLRALKQAPVYYTPPGAPAERALQAAFQRVAHGEVRRDFELVLNDRAVPVRAEADGAIWFDFTVLCEGPRGVADYIELARAYHTLLVSNVPQFTPQTDDAARRFVELVDEVYDRGVNLVLSAAAPIVDLYDGERLRAEFARTESRLIEMQSEDYLAREHQP
ncbi:cell division protein ZapE [Dokdonella fugitiva]|jgi:cell division protein ZapE|uniref:Cell division protein ZapE n=1 Tax=Dokdonella fugitiva TaxID=328517 RepID=A0A4R2IF03_9GAMM|nr:cell division protein ZapE [Dokdonella fugitiva]TCO43283.1 cell division protein ZapE [Dokdonella fugitiva]